MSMVADWSLPIFEIAEKHQDTVLSRVSYCDIFRFDALGSSLPS
ncbi:hypothetical protein ANCDUO_26434 [Ancylostoma duodenale]|uniref:Uncharacterized protein n=1 Tax=Ancylostoma duodenale TaxID=51022 RepID=A0A0C2BIE7_9BILA|nr:hypothetical protein ANCDUO_26434 [Ancylostoma duodenale]